MLAMARPALKLSDEAASRTDSFFTSDSAQVLSPALLSVGSVPEVFCTNPIVLCVSTARLDAAWARGRPLPPVSEFRVVFTIAVAGLEPFQPTTNLLRLDAGVVTGKAVMQPLDVPDSQFVARTTTVSAEVFHGRRRIARSRSLLSAILWADAHLVEAKGRRQFSLSAATRAVVLGRALPHRGRGVVPARLRAEICEKLDDGNGIGVSVSATRPLLDAVGRAPLTMSISFAEHGGDGTRWMARHQSRVFSLAEEISPTKLPASLLVPGLGLERPLRLHLRSRGKASKSEALGYCETSFAELLSQRRFCPCRMDFQSLSADLPVALEIESVSQRRDGSTELCLMFCLAC
jgi:hypothetical protein